MSGDILEVTTDDRATVSMSRIIAALYAAEDSAEWVVKLTTNPKLKEVAAARLKEVRRILRQIRARRDQGR